MYKFSNKSLKRLERVHPNLVKVIKRALELSTTDFTITEGHRTYESQISMVKTGKSQTLKSKHLIQNDGYAHAVDIVPYPVNWALFSFYPIAEAVRKASKELNIRIRWGGCWVCLNDTNKPVEQLVKEYSEARKKAGNKVFIDAPHFELV